MVRLLRPLLLGVFGTSFMVVHSIFYDYVKGAKAIAFAPFRDIAFQFCANKNDTIIYFEEIFELFDFGTCTPAESIV